MSLKSSKVKENLFMDCHMEVTSIWRVKTMNKTHGGIGLPDIDGQVVLGVGEYINACFIDFVPKYTILKNCFPWPMNYYPLNLPLILNNCLPHSHTSDPQFLCNTGGPILDMR
jgi:hypothetical protein